MKNFLILILAMGLAGAAFLTRPGQEDFERYLQKREKAHPELVAKANVDGVEFKDFYLWTVVRKDGRTLYTGVFDHWIDAEQLRRSLPSSSASS
jgi:hypothetical protein